MIMIIKNVITICSGLSAFTAVCVDVPELFIVSRILAGFACVQVLADITVTYNHKNNLEESYYVTGYLVSTKIIRECATKIHLFQMFLLKVQRRTSVKVVITSVRNN